MAENFFYRASPELAAALRQMREERHAFWKREIDPYVREHPNNPPVWMRTGSVGCVGFADDDKDNPPPEGLSRAVRARSFLIPKRSAAGRRWRELIDRFNGIPSHDRVLKAFGVPYDVFAPGVLYMANWMDLDASGEDPTGPNVVVYIGHGYASVPAALTEMKRSEFYTPYEAAQERDRVKAGASS